MGIVHKEIMFQGVAIYGSPPYSYYWDFGDGTTSTDKNPIHIYNKVGVYDYNLTVTDNSGISCSDTGTIEIIKHTFVIGIISNKNTSGNITSFDSLSVWCVTAFPFSINRYTQGEKIKLFKPYLGIVTQRFICGFYYVIPRSGPFPPIYSINIFSSDDSANKVVWLVSAVEGEPLETYKVNTILLNESGEPQPDAEITFNEVTGAGYINPGDTFTVIAPYDGYFVFMLTHKPSGATIFKSSLTKY
ncbi:PDK repeat-containing protein [Thermoplasmatales archaeon SCGC AB-540-F20]|nr:PDK repeat-containing protein [Thermoplasmatales archaeon SCGC AB-540-F20]